MAQSEGYANHGTREALVALWALRGTVADPKSLRDEEYIILPSEELLTEHQAATMLAHLTKPVMCSAFARNGALVVRCRALDSVAQGIHPRAASGLKDWLRTSLPAQSRADVDPYLLLRAAGKSIILRMSDGLAFFEDFHIIFGSTVSPATDEIRAQGAVAIWEFEPGADLETNGERVQIKHRR